MKYEVASSFLASLGFHGLPDNDHVVVLGSGNTTFGHEYYWKDLKTAGTALVDLLRPLDCNNQDETLAATLCRWNAAQIDRASKLVAQAEPADDAMCRCSCSTYDEAVVSLIALGFWGFAGNDHSVVLGFGSMPFTHEYHWCDLGAAGKAVVDLLRMLDGAVHNDTAETLLCQWNSAQVERAKHLVHQARALDDVLRVCS